MAVIAKQRYNLDIAPKGGWVIVYASQHDDGAREIEFEITNQGKTFSIPASINVSVQGIKANKSYFSHSCSYSGNVVTMALADDMTDIVGKAICVLKFTNSSNQKLATAKFVLNVDTDSSSEGVIIDTDAEEIFNQMLNEIRAQAASVSADIAELQSMVGSPLVASSVSVMTNHNKIYVYTGSESGYTNGNWYYWNGSAWTSGGVYNAVAINIDSTPTQGSTNAVSSGGVYDALQNIDNTIGMLSESIDSIKVTDDLNLTNSGVTIAKVSDNQVAIYGEATAVRHFCCFNGQSAVKTTAAGFDKTVEAGIYKIEVSVAGYQDNSFLFRYTYSTFANYSILVSSNVRNTFITLDRPAMIGFTTVVGTNYGTEDNPTYVTLHIEKIIALDAVAREEFQKVKNAILYSVQSLTESESEQARKNIDSVGNDVFYKYNFYDVFSLSDASSEFFRGIQYTKNEDGTWTISGTTSSEQSFKNIISAAELPRYIQRGRKYKLTFNGGEIPIQVFFYYNDSSKNNNVTYNSDTYITIPNDLTGIIIRFRVHANRTVNETVRYMFIPETVTSIDNNYTYNTVVEKTENVYNNSYEMNVSPSITTDSNGWLASVDNDTENETGKTDMAPAIMAMLTETGYCHLGEGIFYVSGNIDMPEGSTLEGCGQKTIIRLLQSVTSGYCIKIQKYNTISNVKITGSYSTITEIGTQRTRTGILFVANKDGNEGEAAFESECCMLTNIWVMGFSDSGIKCHNTSMNIRRGIYATNLYIVNCWAGVNIDYYSEFNKFTNICISACHYGCINNGGNNVFTACTFHAIAIAFYIDGTQPNSAHGTINGCTFCHSGSNNGVAIKIDDVTAGFIISNCQIWYNSVEVNNSEAIVFDGCVFGRGITDDGDVSASIIVSGGNLVLFSGCVFRADVQRPPKITITNNSKTVFNGCYGSESGLPILA